MNSHTAIKVLLRRAHLDRHTEALQHLTHAQTKDMETDDLLFRASAHQLEFGRVLRLLLRRHHVVVHRRELGVVDLDLVVAVLGASFRFCQTDSADLWVREHDCRDVVVGELRVFQLGGAEDAVTELTAGGDGD